MKFISDALQKLFCLCRSSQSSKKNAPQRKNNQLSNTTKLPVQSSFLPASKPIRKEMAGQVQTPHFQRVADRTQQLSQNVSLPPTYQLRSTYKGYPQSKIWREDQGKLDSVTSKSNFNGRGRHQTQASAQQQVRGHLIQKQAQNMSTRENQSQKQSGQDRGFAQTNEVRQRSQTASTGDSRNLIQHQQAQNIIGQTHKAIKASNSLENRAQMKNGHDEEMSFSFGEQENIDQSESNSNLSRGRQNSNLSLRLANSAFVESQFRRNQQQNRNRGSNLQQNQRQQRINKKRTLKVLPLKTTLEVSQQSTDTAQTQNLSTENQSQSQQQQIEIQPTVLQIDPIDHKFRERFRGCSEDCIAKEIKLDFQRDIIQNYITETFENYDPLKTGQYDEERSFFSQDENMIDEEPLQKAEVDQNLTQNQQQEQQKQEEAQQEIPKVVEAGEVQIDTSTSTIIKLSDQSFNQEAGKLKSRIGVSQQYLAKLLCPLCLNFIHHCQTIACGHSYCEKCLDEYLIIRNTCYICEEPSIRNRALVSCFSIDNIIEQIVRKSGDSDLVETWNQQIQEHKQWTEDRKIKKELEVGEKVDLRDTSFVWCQAVVLLKLCHSTKEPFYLLHYEGWNPYFDEMMKASSPRIAPLGHYTGEQWKGKIPKYQMIEGTRQMVAIILNRPLSCSTQERLELIRAWKNVQEAQLLGDESDKTIATTTMKPKVN